MSLTLLILRKRRINSLKIAKEHLLIFEGVSAGNTRNGLYAIKSALL